MANFKNDKELKDKIGDKAFNLLRWVLLTNRSQLFYLPTENELPLFKREVGSKCFQFMAVISSPE